jgi:hypothetical protein
MEKYEAGNTQPEFIALREQICNSLANLNDNLSTINSRIDLLNFNPIIKEPRCEEEADKGKGTSAIDNLQYILDEIDRLIVLTNTSRTNICRFI